MGGEEAAPAPASPARMDPPGATPPPSGPAPLPRPPPSHPQPRNGPERAHPPQSPRKSAQVVDAKDAAYLHGYLHIFACPLNVNECRALPSPVGGDSVFLRDPYRLQPPPPHPGTASPAHPGRRPAGSGREGKGFSCHPDLDPRPAPGPHFPSPRGFPLSHLFTRNDKNCPSRRSCRSRDLRAPPRPGPSPSPPSLQWWGAWRTRGPEPPLPAASRPRAPAGSHPH